MRWLAVRETRVVESADPLNYTYIEGSEGRGRRIKHGT
jgi:hypothetical protein